MKLNIEQHLTYYHDYSNNCKQKHIQFQVLHIHCIDQLHVCQRPGLGCCHVTVLTVVGLQLSCGRQTMTDCKRGRTVLLAGYIVLSCFAVNKYIKLFKDLVLMSCGYSVPDIFGVVDDRMDPTDGENEAA